MAEPRRYELLIDGIPPGPNQASRSWQKNARLRKPFKESVAYQAMACQPATPLARARVTITIIKIGNPYDTDNAYALTKILIDPLKGRLIVDDSPRHIDLVVLQERGRRRCVRILVEELAA